MAGDGALCARVLTPARALHPKRRREVFVKDRRIVPHRVRDRTMPSEAMHDVYEASRMIGVKPIIFASSGGKMLGYELEPPYTEIVAAEYDKVPKLVPLITDDMPVRPNSLCTLARFSARSSAACISTGMGYQCSRSDSGPCWHAPLMRRRFPGYLSHADAVQTVEKCIDDRGRAIRHLRGHVRPSLEVARHHPGERMLVVLSELRSPRQHRRSGLRAG